MIRIIYGCDTKYIRDAYFVHPWYKQYGLSNYDNRRQWQQKQQQQQHHHQKQHYSNASVQSLFTDTLRCKSNLIEMTVFSLSAEIKHGQEGKSYCIVSIQRKRSIEPYKNRTKPIWKYEKCWGADFVCV